MRNNICFKIKVVALYGVLLSVPQIASALSVSSSPLTSVNEDDGYSYTIVDDSGGDATWEVTSGQALPAWLTLQERAVAGTPKTINSSLVLTNVGNITDYNVDIAENYYYSDATTHDTLSYTGTLPANVTANFDVAKGTLTFTGAATPSDWQTLLRTVQITLNAGDASSIRKVNFTEGKVPGIKDANGVMHYYELVNVSGGVTWTDAQNGAAAKTYNGREGYLATITSSAENDFIRQKISANTWIGASDSETTNTWKWVTGPEAGTDFFTQTSEYPTTPSTGNIIGGNYNNWDPNEPNGCLNNSVLCGGLANYEDYAHLLETGEWNDFKNDKGTEVQYYLVEYGAMPSDDVSSTYSQGFFVSTNYTLSGTPTNTNVGNHIVKLTGTDPSDSSSTTHNFTITVNNINDAPSITSTAGTTATEDIEYTYTATVTDVDDSNDGTNLTWSLSGEPTDMVVSTTGKVTWTPGNGVSTSGEVTLSVADGGENGAVTATENFTVTVTAVNDAPSITSTAGTAATEDTEYTYTAAVTDVDDSNNGTDLTWSLSNEPTGMVVSTTGTVTWTPVEGVTTSGEVTLSVVDGGEDGAVAATENFTITVSAVNDAPSITSTAGTTATEDTEYTYTAAVTDVDDSNDGTDLTWSLSGEPTGMAVSTTGKVTWTPGNGVSTSGVVTLSVADGGENGAAAATENFTITVTAVNDSPNITSTAGTAATEDTEYTYTAAVTDVDDSNNGTDLTWSLSGAPAGMVVSNTGTVTWTPAEGVITSGAVTLSVADGGEDGAAAATETFTITVTAVNDAPVFNTTGITTATENSVYTYTPTVSDPDGDLTSITATTLPDWLSLQTGGSSLINTVAGTGDKGFFGDGGAATSAKFTGPTGVSVDANGNVYIADRTNHRIRKIDTSGNISTVAGNGNYEFDGDNADATTRSLYYPEATALDSNGNLFIVDSGHNRIRKVDSNGEISTVAGTGVGGYSGDGGAATSAQLSMPIDIAIDSSDNIYIVDMLYSIVRKIDGSGIITTVAGNGTAGFSGDTGAATSAQLYYPAGIAVDSASNLYIADNYNHRIRKVAADGTITTIAGTGVRGSGGDGAAATAATLQNPKKLTFDSNGNLYIADSNNHKIRKIDSNGTISTVAGTGTRGFSGDGGAADSAKLFYPQGIAFDANANLYIADYNNNRIRKISKGTPGLTGTPGVSGVYDISLRVTDGTLSSDQDYQVTVVDVNDPPVLPDTSYVVSESIASGSVVGTVTATDEDGVSPSSGVTGGEVLTYAITAGNTNGDFTINSDSGQITSVNALNAYIASNYSLTVTVQDDSGSSDTAAVSITVSNEADAPVAIADTSTIDEDYNATINLIANDTDADNNINAGSVVITANPAHGSVTVDTSGVATYVPDANYNGTDSFNYKMYDATSLVSNEVVVSITVNAVNDTPVTTNAVLHTDEDIVLNATLAQYVSDADGQNDVSTYTIAANGSHGTATLNNTGLLQYTPDNNYYGFDTITFLVTDAGNATSNISTVTINIAEINDIPVVYLDDATTVEDTAVNIDVLANDTDDGTLDVSTVAVLNQASHGTAVVQGDGTITYTPGAHWYGSDSFSYTVKDNGLNTGGSGTDGVLLSNEGVVTLTVSSINDTPVAEDDTFTLDEDSVMLLNLHANDTDVEGELSGSDITLETQPDHGTAALTSDGLVRYVPTIEYNGSDSFTYTISDGTASSNTATVSVTITAINDAPTVSTPLTDFIVNEDASDIMFSLEHLFTDNDNDDSAISKTVQTNTNSSLVTASVADNILTLSFAADSNGSADITIRGNSDGDTVDDTFTVTVSAENDAPVFTSAQLTAVNEDVLYSYSITTTDAEGDAVRINAVNIPAWLAFADNGNGTAILTGTPVNGDVGNHTVSLKASDDTLSSYQNFTVTVSNTNDAPTVTSAAITEATEGSPYSYTLVGADIDTGDTVTYSAVTDLSSSWLSFTAGTGVLSGTPTNGDVGNHTVVLRVTDAGGLSVDQSFTVTVHNTNNTLIIDSAAITAATENDAYSYTLRSHDIDAADNLTSSFITKPAWLSFAPITEVNSNGATIDSGVLSGTPGNDDVGDHTVVLRITDGTTPVHQIFTITVANVNDAPVISGTPNTGVDEDALYEFIPTVVDADAGDTQSFTVSAKPDWASFSSTTGKLSGTPTNDDVGTYSNIEITVTDSSAATDTLSAFSITVGNTNDAPVISSTAPTEVNEDSLYSYTFAASDIDSGDSLTYSAVGIPSWLTFNSGTQVLSGTPTQPNVGKHTITLRVSDGSVNVDQAFEITVVSLNNAPVITSTAPISATEDILYRYTPTVTDVDDANNGTDLTWSLSNEPDGMLVSSTGTVTWKAVNGVSTSGAVTLSVADGGENGAAAATQTFIIAVTAVNDPPEITSTAGTSATEGVKYTYIAAVTDEEDFNNGTDLIWSLTNAPAGMAVSGTGIVTWTPAQGVTTSGLVTLRVEDSGALFDTEDFTIVVLKAALPALTTDAVTNIQSSSAAINGNITDDGGSSVIERGACWSTSPLPTISDDCMYETLTGSEGIGEFTIPLIHLRSRTTYFVRLYATNSAGTVYGNEREFKTRMSILFMVIPTLSGSSPVQH